MRNDIILIVYPHSFNRKGQYRFPYNGDNKHQAIVDFMRDPTSQQKKKEVVDESWSQDSEVVHLTCKY